MSSHVKTVVIMAKFPCPSAWTQIVKCQCRQSEGCECMPRLAYEVAQDTCYACLEFETGNDAEAMKWACRKLEESGVLSANQTTIILMTRHDRKGEGWRRHSYNYVKKTAGDWAVGPQISDESVCCAVGKKAEAFWQKALKRGG